MGGCASVSSRSTVDDDLDNILYDNKRNVEAPIKVVDQLKVSYDCYGNRCLNEYTTLKFLGSGRYAEVRLCVNCLTGQKCAVKEMPRNLVYIQGNNIYEAQVLKNLNHPNIVKLYEVIDSPTEETVYLVFEYIDGGSVMKLDEDGNADRPTLAEGLCRNYLKQIVLGLEYLHSKQIVHQDIKPDNILISKDGRIVKLADFGVAKLFKTESAADLLKATVGTPAYYAPEICRGGYFSGKQADIWALGVTMYVFLYGTLPFKANGIQLFMEIQTNPVVLRDDLRQVTKSLRDLLSRMLDKDILTRITLPEIKDHPWTNDMKENDQIITEISITSGDDLFTTDSTTISSPMSAGEEEGEICILVVDDVHMTRLLMEKLLKTLISKKVTLRVDAVPNGNQAIESCQLRQYRLILMDIHMTCISGYEATTRIREMEKKTNQPRSRIVGITADTQEGVFDRCLASGMDDLIIKPIRPSRLREVAYSVGIPIHSYNSVNDIELAEPLVKGHPLQVAWEQFLQKTGEMSAPSTPQNTANGTSPLHTHSSSS